MNEQEIFLNGVKAGMQFFQSCDKGEVITKEKRTYTKKSKVGGLMERWTPEEDAILRANLDLKPKQLFPMFKGRTRIAISYRKMQMIKGKLREKTKTDPYEGLANLGQKV